MNETEANCQHLKVLDEKITREREMRKALEVTLEERDRRYEDRFKAQETAVFAALSAQEKMTNAAFAASEKAITKAEMSQTVYNSTHNDLTRKMDSQYKDMLPRTESEAKFKTLEDKIADLRESRSTGEGKTSVTTAMWLVASSVMSSVVTAVIVWLLIKK